MLKILLLILAITICECVYIYSSFWAPLFDPRILNYRVDLNFDPDAGRRVSEEYRKVNGYRGQNLIANLGNGNGPSKRGYDTKVIFLSFFIRLAFNRNLT